MSLYIIIINIIVINIIIIYIIIYHYYNALANRSVRVLLRISIEMAAFSILKKQHLNVRSCGGDCQCTWTVFSIEKAEPFQSKDLHWCIVRILCV